MSFVPYNPALRPTRPKREDAVSFVAGFAAREPSQSPSTRLTRGEEKEERPANRAPLPPNGRRGEVVPEVRAAASRALHAPQRNDVDIERELERAFEQGREAGRTEMEARLTRLREQFRALQPALLDTLGTRRHLLAERGEEISALVLELTGRIIGECFVMDAGAIQNAVGRAIEQFPTEDEVWIRTPTPSVDAIALALDPERQGHVIGDSSLTESAAVESHAVPMDEAIEAAQNVLTDAVGEWLATRS